MPLHFDDEGNTGTLSCGRGMVETSNKIKIFWGGDSSNGGDNTVDVYLDFKPIGHFVLPNPPLKVEVNYSVEGSKHTVRLERA